MLYLPKSQPAPDCLAHEKTKADGDYKCGGGFFFMWGGGF